MNLEKIRTDKQLALEKLDIAMDRCEPELNSMSEIMKKAKNDFLYSYRYFKNQKISELEFLKNSAEFAQKLDAETEMYSRFSQILEPLTIDWETKSQLLRNMEAKHD